MPAFRFLVVLLGVVTATALTRVLAAEAEPELHVRGGLPGLAARASADSGVLRIAYLGGSITAAEGGWRSLTTAHLRERFPKLTIEEIPAGLPGTGSNLGVCRLENDVLRHQPDIVFVEFAVNDTGVPAARIERTMEGIVRQTRRRQPRAELIFVYTISTPALPDLQAGKFQPSARAMETVAAHYGIPTIHFGVEVARRVTAGTLTFKPPAPATAATAPSAAANDVPVFALDGVHPTAEGHRVYFDVVRRSLATLLDVRTTASALPTPPSLPAPLHADNWENAELRLFDQLATSGDWTLLAPDDPMLRGVTKNLLPPTWRAATPGAAITFEFTGRKFGLLGIAAPDSGKFRVTVDDRPPVEDTFFDAYASPTFCRTREWFYPGELPDGLHRVRVELLEEKVDKAAIKEKAGRPLDDAAPYAPHRLTLSGALVIGSPAP